MKLKQNLKKWAKVGLISAGVLMLSSCAHKRPDQASINDANSAYSANGQAEASGLGSEASFGDQAGEGRSLLSHRVYYFDFDSNAVHEGDKAAIFANANYLASHPNTSVIVQGHTDPRGSREYNIGLGERRAKAVSSLLAAHGVGSSQVRVVSYGSEKLAAPGRTEADYQLDRRVVLVYQR